MENSRPVGIESKNKKMVPTEGVEAKLKFCVMLPNHTSSRIIIDESASSPEEA